MTTAADDLRAAVAALTEQTKTKIMLEVAYVKPGDPTTVEAVIPALLEQLDDAAEQGAEGGGGRSVPGSRPPTGLDVLDVRHVIADGVAYRCTCAGLPRREDTGEALTGLAEHLIAAVLDQSSEVTDNDVAELTHAVKRWRRDAEAVLRIAEVEAREIPGVACPACWTVWVSPDGPSEPRQAALFILVGVFGARATQCRACSAVWWLGTAMDHLGLYTRAALNAGALAVRGRTA